MAAGLRGPDRTHDERRRAHPQRHHRHRPGRHLTIHADAGAKRPADWKAALDPNALQGKKIGYFPSAFTGGLSYGQSDGTPEAMKARFADIAAAGATMVPITATTPASAGTGR